MSNVLLEPRSLTISNSQPKARVSLKEELQVTPLGEVWFDTCLRNYSATQLYPYCAGGATQYVASGLSDADVARFGRWKSDAYKAYVFGHSEAMKATLQKAVHLVPRLERN